MFMDMLSSIPMEIHINVDIIDQWDVQLEFVYIQIQSIDIQQEVLKNMRRNILIILMIIKK